MDFRRGAPIANPRFAPSNKRERELSEDDDDDDDDARSDGATEVPREHDFKRPRHSFGSKDDYTVIYIYQVSCQQKRGRQTDHSGHVKNALYLDAPRLFPGDDKASQLRGKKRIQNYNELVASAGIVIYKTYSCDAYLQQVDTIFEQVTLPHLQEPFLRANQAHFFRLPCDGPEALPQSIRLDLQSTDFVNDLSTVLGNSDILSRWQDEESLSFPFPFYFHHAAEVQEVVRLSAGPELQRYTRLLLRCISELGSKDHAEAETLFSSGLVSDAHFSKLFRVGELVVTRKDTTMLAYRLEQVQETQDGLSLDCWSYDFNGAFKVRQTKLHVRRPLKKEPVSVNSLEIFPLRLDLSSVRDQLLSRGRKFWDCRGRKYIHYTAPHRPFESRTAQHRYMIDYNMYRVIHQPEEGQQAIEHQRRDDAGEIPPETLEQLEGPDHDEMLMLLPAYVQGFGFLDKKWRTLQLDHINELKWNTEAFDQLVLDKRKKDLVKALVYVHLTSRKGVDIIEGKGNGLIILLHGGPGTGKTLTAETVAELAKKPLYRVTCGDMGIDPEGVEKYLESVLHIGTEWDCVVLLDEADIFLERRTTEDIKRNALVSVFLRVLEYYDGILILTTNRIGLFDEAFKSRIQLAVHYPSLDRDGRAQVWLSALRSIPEGQVGLDLQKLQLHVPKLSEQPLNGRQIRSTVHCAMQLAMFHNERLELSHFESVIAITMEFEKYVTEVRGEDDDEAARTEGLRC
ncbi:hypothetical protein AYO21_09405 [Fonsecaea monophora]|uniref:AAA+ ATPase domain-containing protein n=1 Tax=Fonsecaea monophora TaxID=254056 RepID=A0A177EYT5_9EURO|nr:hypothetical protein AYO21_09405 [Fonsecaea monophora]OAG36420.1 hypothetical protein AYO21_09405 [Fonsecaea monophora]